MHDEPTTALSGVPATRMCMLVMIDAVHDMSVRMVR